jgi:glycosyltransferase involved in cell wall biosynthesis
LRNHIAIYQLKAITTSIKNNHKQLITVVTTVLNGENTLRQAIESVLSQKNRNIEYVIIDGGSTDNSIEIIKSYGSQIDFWISESDSGIYEGWNKGLLNATGKYIAFLGSDDFFEPDALITYSNFVIDNPNFDYISSRVRYIDDNCKVIGIPWRWVDYRRSMLVAHVGSLHKRTLFERFGVYDERLKLAGDYEFLLRPGENLNAGFVDFISANMRAGGVSNRLAKRSIEETMMVKIQHKSSCFCSRILSS